MSFQIWVDIMASLKGKFNYIVLIKYNIHIYIYIYRCLIFDMR